jgi:acyl-CoA oxidase
VPLIDVVHRKQKLLNLIQDDPIFKKEDIYQGSREDKIGRALAMCKRMVELREAYQLSSDDMYILRNFVDEPLPLTLHETMFIPVLQTQGSPEQAQYWIPLAETYRIVGSYAQTELAHGSNLSGLETTATYIPETDEFEINTPDITGAKWWVGGLGVISTHTIVQAKLILNGKDYGPHPFIVPIRSLEDHKPFPGVRVGDIGQKMGFNMIDNGWIIFQKHRIPRNNMLMRFAQVTSKGAYVKPPHSKIAYSGMVFVRTKLVGNAAFALAKACVIAVRYCATRRQFTVANSAKQSAGLSSQEETPVIMYPMVQARIFPKIAEAYAILFASHEMDKMYDDMIKRLQTFDVSTLPAVHAHSSALKSYCTGVTSDSIDQLRQTTGGHGFMMSSGLPLLQCNYTPAATYEGENYLLTQQTARFLLKQLHKYQTQSEPLHPFVSYLDLVAGTGTVSSQPKLEIRTPSDWFNPTMQLNIYAHRAARLSGELAHAISHEGIAFAELNVECARLSKAHAQYVLLKTFQSVLHKALQSNELTSVYPVLKLVCDVFALTHLVESLGDFTEDGYLTRDQVKHLRVAHRSALSDMLRDAVGLVDAWEFSDYELNSALARTDGKVYEALLESALNDPINQFMNGKMVVKGYKEYIRPILTGEGRATIAKSKL